MIASFLWHEEPIATHHNRKTFDCGEPALNEYLQRYARQNHESGGAKTFVAVADDAPLKVLGYYSLSPASLDYAKTPALVRRGLGRYDVPIFRLGRLAVDKTLQGQKLGSRLLFCALERCFLVAQEVGGVALLIDAKHAKAAAWYQTFGAVPLEDNPLQLVIPLSTVSALIK
jgi:GNAT superfamily N-acetyltransferase